MRRRDAMARINNKLTRTISFSIEINYGPSGGGGGGTSSSGEGVAGVPGRGGVGEPIKEESEDEGFHDSNTRPNSNEKVKGNPIDRGKDFNCVKMHFKLKSKTPESHIPPKRSKLIIYSMTHFLKKH